MGIAERERGRVRCSPISPSVRLGTLYVENEGFNKWCVDTLTVRLWASVVCRVEERGSEVRLCASGDRTMNRCFESDLTVILIYICYLWY